VSARCQCQCGCKTKTRYKYCASCHWDMIDAADGGSFAQRRGAKRHAPFVVGVVRAGPMLVPIERGEGDHVKPMR
jgi:hypothetical protein